MLKIRLRRMGSRHRPFYRVVVSDSRQVPTSIALEEIGYYDPRKKPVTLKIDSDRVAHWQKKGAQVSKTVRNLLKKAGQLKAASTAEAASAPAETTAKAAPEKAAKAEAAAEPAEKVASSTEAASKEAGKEAEASEKTETPEQAEASEKTAVPEKAEKE